MGRRILVTGLGTFWGSRLAQALEARDDVDLIVGVDARTPRLPLTRTEFVRADPSYAILQRVVRATHVDTVLHTHLQADSTRSSPRRLHETNVIGTMNLLAAAAAPESQVRRVVVKTATLVYGSHFDDPYFFREDSRRALERLLRFNYHLAQNINTFDELYYLLRYRRITLLALLTD